MDAQRLGHLVADVVHGVERDARILGDQPDLVPPYGTKLPLREGGQIVGAEPDAALVDPPAGRQQPYDGLRQRALARPRLPRQRDDLAWPHVEIDPAYGRRDRIAGAVGDRQAADLQQWNGHRGASHATSRALATRLVASAIAAGTSPGSVDSHHAWRS